MANLISWLGQQLHGVEAQINPWDGGQTYNSVVNNAPIQRPPQQQPRQPLRQNQPAPQGILNTPRAPGISAQPPTFTAPRAPVIQLPQGASPIPGIPLSTWAKMTPQVQQRLIVGNNNVDRAKSNVFNPTAIIGDTVGQLGNLGANLVGQGVKSLTQGSADIYNELNTGFDKQRSAQNTQDFMNSTGINKLGNGTGVGANIGQAIGGMAGGLAPAIVKAGVDIPGALGTNLGAANFDTSKYSPEEANRLNQYLQSQAVTPRTALVNAGETALNIATGGNAKLVESLGAKVGGKIADRFLSTITDPATRVAASKLVQDTIVNSTKNVARVGSNAAYGAGFNTLETARDPNATGNDYLKAAGTGALVGSALPVVLDGAGKLLKTARDATSIHGTLLRNSPEYAQLNDALGKTTDPQVQQGIASTMQNMQKRAVSDGSIMNPFADARKVAETKSGVLKTNVLNDNEANTLSDYADMQMGRWDAPNSVRNNVVMQARHAAKQAGFDVTNMSPADASRTIDNYLQARDIYKQTYDRGKSQMLQQGFAKVPFGKEPTPNPTPDPQSTAAYNKSLKDFANEVKSDQTKSKPLPTTPKTEAAKPVKSLKYGDSIQSRGVVKQYTTTHPDGKTIVVQGEPVSLVKGVETFAHKGDGGWVVSEAKTGRYIGTGITKDGAIVSASSNIKNVGESKFKQLIKDNSQPAPHKSIPKPTSKAPKVPQNLLRKAQKPVVKPGDTVVNSLTAKAKRQSLSDGVVKELNATHEIRNTKELADRVDAIASKMTDKQLLDEAHQALSVKTGSIDDAGVALTHKAIERMDAKNNIRETVDLHDALSKHLTRKGQEIQAASLLYNMTPQGRLYKATRDLTRAGVKITDELAADLKAQTEAIKKASATDKPGLTAKFLKTVADNIPKDKMDNILSVWKAGLLSGVKTHGGNFVSNGSFGVLHDASSPLAVGLDKGLSALGKTKFGKEKLGLTGERSRSITPSGRVSGAKEGAGKAVNTLKTGIDERNIIGSKYEIHGEINFKNPIVQKVFGKPSNFVFRAMSAGDQPFYYSQLKNSLYDLGKTDGINKGYKGRALADHANEMVKNPTERMLNTAMQEAKQSVLSQDNKLASNIQATLNKSSIIGKAGQFIAPFIKVPTNFLSRTVDFTPVLGHTKAIIKAVSDVRSGKGLDQRGFTQAISEATTGGAIVGLGAVLATSGQLSGDYPKNDQKEAQRWKSQKIQPNSVKIAGQWVSLNYLGPVGMLLGMGKDYHDNGGGANGSFQAAAGIGNSLMNQSFLTGFSGFSSAISDPQRTAKTFVGSQASSVVPSWMNDTANLLDDKQRDTSSGDFTNSVKNSVESRIPGLRNTLPVKQDVYGNQLDQRTGRFNQLLNPLKPSNNTVNNVTAEVERLHNSDPTNKDLQVTPTPINSYLSNGGVKTPLTDAQKYQLQGAIGQATQTTWGKLMETPQYLALDDTGKAAALNKARTDITAVATNDFMLANNMGKKKLTQAQVALSNGGDNTDKYTSDTTKVTSVSATPSDKYQTALDNYNKNKSTMSPVDQYKAQQALPALKVKSNFSNDVVSLYGMSKADAYNYVTNSKDGAQQASDLIRLDRAMYDAGVTKYLKYKTGIAPAVARGRSGSRGGGRKSSGVANVTRALTALRSGSKIKIPTFKPMPSSGAVKASTFKVPTFKQYKVAKIPKIPSVKVNKISTTYKAPKYKIPKMPVKK